MVDKTDVALVIGANIDQFTSAMGHVVDATKHGCTAAENAFKHLAGVSEEVGGQVVDHQAAMAAAFEEMQQQMKAAMDDFIAGVKTVSSELWEKVKEDSRAAAIAMGVAFSVLGLGAIYTAYKVIKESAGFIAGLFTGESYKSENVDRLKAAAEQMEVLRGKINLTREEASALAIAFDRVGVSQDTYLGTSGALIAAARENGDAFKALGIDTSMTGDHVADFQRIGSRAVAVLEGFAIGYDRDKAAREAGLPSYAALKEALKVTNEEFSKAYAEATEYSLLIGNDVVDEMGKYNTAVAEFKHNSDLTWNGFSRAIADGVMPILGDLADFFQDGFPSVVNFTRGVVGSVVSLFHGFMMSIYALTETIMGAIRAVGEGVSGLAKGIAKAMTGDMQGAWKAIADGGKAASAELGKSFDSIAARAEVTSKRIRMAFLGGQEGSEQSKSDTGLRKLFSPAAKEEKANSHEAPSRMAAWEAELAETKVYFQKQYELREYSKEQELEYWQSILRNVKTSGQERIAIGKKIADLELEVMKKKLQQQNALESQAINEQEKIALDALKVEEQLAEQALDQDRITKEQLIALQQQFEDRRFAIQQEAQATRIAALLGDPNMDPVALQKLLDQMEEIQRKHELAMGKLSGDAVLAAQQKWAQAFAPITSAFEKSITGMIMGTTTLRKSMQNIFQSILGEFVNMCVKMAARWAAMELAKTATTKTNTTVRAMLEKIGLLETTAAQAAASGTTVAVKATEATAVVGANAAEAASGAAASVASIPFVGWAMAAGVFAATMAMVLGAKGSIKSASGGFDIPAGVNPVTQLHQEEMVLPAHIANPLRESLAGGGMGGGLPPIYITAMDSRDVQRSLKQGGALHKALKDLDRRGVRS